MRIIHGANARDGTNILFVCLHVMTCVNYIEYKTAALLCNMNYELLTMNVVNMFHSMDDNCHDTRQWGNVKQIYVRTIVKAMCISTVGVGAVYLYVKEIVIVFLF